MADNTATQLERPPGEVPVSDDQSAQDVASRLEDVLFPSDEETEATDDGALEDGEDLPEDDDLDSEDDVSDEDETETEDEDEDDLSDEDLSLADYLGISEDRLHVDEESGDVKFKAIIDGETKLVGLEDMAASYQLMEHVNNKSSALGKEREQFEETRNTVAQQLTERIEGVQSLSKILEEQLVADFNAIDWDQLRIQDPANWTALRQDYAEKAQRIQAAQGKLEEERQAMAAQQNEELQSRFQEYVQEQHSQLLVKHPEWADQEKFKTDLTEMQSFLSVNYGYSDEEFAQIHDHRLFDLIGDAMKYRQGKKVASKKRVKRVPKLQKPGVSAERKQQLAKARDVKARKKALKDSGGSVSAVASSIVDRM